MVRAIAAGVSFSAHPVTGARDRIVIEAVHGLGVLLTDGRVVPEHVVVQRHTGVVLLARAPRQRELASVTDAGVTQIARVDGGSGQVPVLSAAQVARVVDLTLRSEVAIGAAADVEWAFDSRGQLWVVQARPITTLPAP